MKHLHSLRTNAFAAFIAGLLLFGALELVLKSVILHAQAQPTPPFQVSDGDDEQLNLQTIASRLPNQSHEMQDVGYHFENLWFAGTKNKTGHWLATTCAKHGSIWNWQ